MTDSDKINIEIPVNYQDPFGYEVYSELEKLLYNGFLTSHANVKGFHFVFKTINGSEMTLIDYMRVPGPIGLKNKYLYEDYFIAYSIFMINGENLIDKRPESINRIVKVVSKFTSAEKSLMVKELSKLNNKAVRLYPLVEFYAQESKTRIKWYSLRMGSINEVKYTGIPGTEKLGLNTAQRTFLSVSHVLDRKDQAEQDWVNSKFIAGAFVGKEMNRVHEQDKTRIANEKRELEELKSAAIYAYLNNKDTTSTKDADKIITLSDGRRARVVRHLKSDTAQELAKELSIALSGEMDEHDKIIEEYSRKMQEEQKARDLAASRTASVRSLSSLIPEGSKSLGPVTDGNLIQRLSKLRTDLEENGLEDADRSSSRYKP